VSDGHLQALRCLASPAPPVAAEAPGGISARKPPMASLQRLEEEVESFVRGTQEALAEEATGRAPRADIAAVERAHPLPASADTLAAVREAATSAQTPEAQRPRLLALVPFLAHTVVDARVRSEDDALRAARRAAVVSAADVARPLEGAWQ